MSADIKVLAVWRTDDSYPVYRAIHAALSEGRPPTAHEVETVRRGLADDPENARSCFWAMGAHIDPAFAALIPEGPPWEQP